MKTDLAITQKTFDELLTWLDANREDAGQKYEDIRRSLIKIFAWRGCSDAEGMADAAINIVAQKVWQLRQTYEGNPQNYFYGVARNLIREYQDSRTVSVPFDDTDMTESAIIDDTDDEAEMVDACLTRCLERLEPSDRELVLAYYAKDGQAKIKLRKDLAEKLGIDANALRVRMHRIRLVLAQCMEGCLKTISPK
jgi:RNA polymerase sigma factor (sigma-70 family)